MKIRLHTLKINLANLKNWAKLRYNLSIAAKEGKKNDVYPHCLAGLLDSVLTRFRAKIETTFQSKNILESLLKLCYNRF